MSKQTISLDDDAVEIMKKLSRRHARPMGKTVSAALRLRDYLEMEIAEGQSLFRKGPNPDDELIELVIPELHGR